MPDTEVLSDESPDLKTEEQIEIIEPDDDGFVPKKSGKEYHKMWREVSAEAAKSRKELARVKREKLMAEEAQLKEQGKWKDMYESTEKAYKNLKGVLESSARSVSFRQSAIKAGCKPEIVEVLEKSADIASIELDDNYRPNLEMVGFMVDQLKEKYGDHFFQAPTRVPKDAPPKKPEPAATVVSDARKAKTQAEFDAVLKKHGRA